MKLRYSKNTSKEVIISDYEQNRELIAIFNDKIEAMKEKVLFLKSENQNINKTYRRRYGESLKN